MNPLYGIVLLILIHENYSFSKDEKCADYAKDISHHSPTVSYSPPNPIGKWVSSQCEIVPNPKYIMRKVNILSQKWETTIYHYNDSWCTVPNFKVKVSGRYEILPATATPNSKGSYASIFHFTNIYFSSHNSKMIETVINKLLDKCPLAIPKISSMQKDDVIELDDFVNKDIPLQASELLKSKACRYYFALHPGTFRKVRMTGEKRKMIIEPERYDQLYFAGILPPYMNKNPMDISEKFQYPLSRDTRPNCDVCKTITKIKKESRSPKLQKPKGRKYFNGGWVSPTCVADDDKTFQSKFFKFDYDVNRADRGTFIAQDNYFSDSVCRKKKINMKVGGKFRDVSVKRDVEDVYKVILHFNWLAMTIYDDATLSLVRNAGSSCGDPTKWRVGVEQNLTKSNGCKSLGFAIPSSMKFLVRVSRTKVAKTFYINPIEEKGTYFSSHFVACDTVTENYKRRIVTTTPTPKLHVVPQVKDFNLNDNYNRYSAASTPLLSTCVTCLTCFLYAILYLV